MVDVDKECCLFINSSSILEKLKQEEKFYKKYSSIEFNKEEQLLEEVVDKLSIKFVIIGVQNLSRFTYKEVEGLTSIRLKGIRIFEAETFYEIVNERIPIVKLEGKEYLADDIFSIKMKKHFSDFKRLFDIFFVLFLTPLALPLLCLGSLLIYITSSGGAFYSQVRVGKGGKHFTIYKIRTMVKNNGGFTVANDARVTKVGKFLRLSKIDELPQLYNILIGDMSVIGPRPEQPKYVDKYSKENPFYKLRHMIRPGVSGWSQVHLPKATPEDSLKKLEYDLYYIKRYSWKLDIRIFIQTLKIVLTFNSH